MFTIAQIYTVASKLKPSDEIPANACLTVIFRQIFFTFKLLLTTNDPS